MRLALLFYADAIKMIRIAMYKNTQFKSIQMKYLLRAKGREKKSAA